MTRRHWRSPNLPDMLALYLIADPEQSDHDLTTAVTAALAGGVTAVQLRAKALPDHDHWRLAMSLRALCHDHHALFLVNDRLDIALAAQADGVHLGVTDLPPWVCRWLAGPDFVIGYSPASDDTLHLGKGANYLGVGPVFGTASKADAGPPLGLTGFSRRIKPADLPIVAIGGVTPINAPETIRAGAAGVAVMSAILRAPDPEVAANALAAAVMVARG